MIELVDFPFVRIQPFLVRLLLLLVRMQPLLVRLLLLLVRMPPFSSFTSPFGADITTFSSFISSIRLLQRTAKNIFILITFSNLLVR
mgnify:CR=1 FL=1